MVLINLGSVAPQVPRLFSGASSLVESHLHNDDDDCENAEFVEEVQEVQDAVTAVGV